MTDKQPILSFATSYDIGFTNTQQQIAKIIPALPFQHLIHKKKIFLE